MNLVPVYACKFDAKKIDKRVELMVRVRQNGMESRSVTILSARNAGTLATLLQTRTIGRIVLGDGAGIVGFHVEDADSETYKIEVSRRGDKHEAICQSDEQMDRLAEDLLSAIE